MLSAICFNLDQSKILFSGNGLSTYQDIIEYQSICMMTIKLMTTPWLRRYLDVFFNPLPHNPDF